MSTSGPRVVVVGAGALGLSTAWHLVRAGHRDVTVLEGTHVAAGSSSRSVGMVETQYLDPYEIAMRAYGRRVVDQLEQEHGLAFVRQGYLRLAHDEADLTAYKASAAAQAEAGCEGRLISAAQVAQLVPDLAPGACIGGLWGPTDGHVDGHRYCELLAGLVRDGGGAVLTGCAVTAVEAGPTLVTPRGRFPADIVVNAPSAWLPCSRHCCRASLTPASAGAGAGCTRPAPTASPSSVRTRGSRTSCAHSVPAGSASNSPRPSAGPRPSAASRGGRRPCRTAPRGRPHACAPASTSTNGAPETPPDDPGSQTMSPPWSWRWRRTTRHGGTGASKVSSRASQAPPGARQARTVRSQSTDRLLMVNERHLRRVLERLTVFPLA